MLRRSTIHPPGTRSLTISVTACACPRAANGFVITSARVILVAPLPEEIEADLARRGRYEQVQVPGAGTQRLEAGFRAPLRAEPVLHGRAQGVRPTGLARRLSLCAIPGVHHHERLRADRPPRRDLGTRERIRHVARSNLEIVERNAEIGHDGALQLAGDERRGGAAHER